MIAVLVLNWNGKKHLSECFESLQKQTHRDFETYLVDNGSEDGSISFTQEKFPWVRIIELKQNRGYTGAYNIAAQKVETDFLFFLNNDVSVKEDCIEELMKKALKAEILGCKLLFYNRRNKVHHAGIKILPIGSGYEIGHEEDGRFDEEKYVGAVCGAAMFVRRDIFLSLLFDEDYEAYSEDVDVCWRAWLTGRKVLYVPTAIIYHKFGASYEHASPRVVYLNQKNRLQNMMKNFSFPSFLKAIIIDFAYDGTRALIFLTKGRFDLLWAMMKGYLYVLIHLFHIMEKRRIVQKGRKVSDRELYRRGFISTYSEAKREYDRLKKIKGSITH